MNMEKFASPSNQECDVVHLGSILVDYNIYVSLSQFLSQYSSRYLALFERTVLDSDFQLSFLHFDWSIPKVKGYGFSSPHCHTQVGYLPFLQFCFYATVSQRLSCGNRALSIFTCLPFTYSWKPRNTQKSKQSLCQTATPSTTITTIVFAWSPTMQRLLCLCASWPPLS